MRNDQPDTPEEVFFFGNTKLLEETPEHPLVTFALFAYNQEQYIREAVECALNQAYSPLEIILSDDCSSDNTFSLMKKTASSYEGAHRVILRRNLQNMGLAAHVNLIAAKMRGSIIVMAAGDDRSRAERTPMLVRVFTGRPCAYAVFSDYYTVPSNATAHKHGRFNSVVTMTEIIAARGGVQIGATYAYRRECLTWPTPLPDWVKSEDRILPLRASLLGSLCYLSERLVAYRVSDNSVEISHRRARNSVSHSPQHFKLINNEITIARRERRIRLLTYLHFVSINFLVAVSTQLMRSGNWSRTLASLLYLPVRIGRKASRLYYMLITSDGR